MKKLAGVGIALLMLAVAGSYAYRQMVTSPEYSLWQIKMAVDQHDLASFNKYVDIEGILGEFIDVALKQTPDVPKPESAAEEFGQTLGMGLIESMKPQLIQEGKKAISDAIETGDFGTTAENDSSSDKTLLGILKSLGDKKNSFKGIEYSKTDGEIAIVGLNIHHEEKNSDLLLELKMRNMGDYWQLARVNNLADVMQKLAVLK